METHYYWQCPCGKRGRVMNWHKMVKNLHRHHLEHERRLEWGIEVDFKRVEKVGA